MHDELIERLRTTKVTVYKAGDVSLLQEAADVIERLAKEKEFLSEQVAHWQSETVKTDCEVWIAENGKPPLDSRDGAHGERGNGMMEEEA